MPISINVSLFAHIELDSELQGRFGVQGNTFTNTFGYLNHYLKTLSSITPEVQKLSSAMDALVMREKAILGIGNQSVKLDALTVKIAKDVESLLPGQEILLPGGWAGKDSPGHAMIYQFEKNSEGDLLFSIYNSGSGIKYHEKTSSTEKELYSPVKTYKLSQPIDSVELQNHIKRLITSQLPAANKRKYDAEMIYNDINVGLAFMNAELIPQDLSAPHTTTAGQLSGTCAQRSIHQMLKIMIGSSPKYQQLIFDFKLYALRDFIKTHPAPRSQKITAFIQKAIVNNLRILQNPGVFDDEQIRNVNIKALDDLKQQLQTENVKKEVSSWFKRIDFSWFRGLVSASPVFTHHLAKQIDSFNKKPAVSLNAYPSLMPAVRQTHVLSDLAQIITQCQAQQENNPAWVMAQIEQTLLALPIPSSSKLAPPYYEKISFYDSITSAEDFEIIGKRLDELHTLYEHASKKLLNEATLPTQIITYCSFMALRDYFDATGEAITTKPSFHSFFHTVLFRYLNSFAAYPFLATKNPIYDKRLNDLLTLTYHTKDKEVQPELLQDEKVLLHVLDQDPYLKGYLEKKAALAKPEDALKKIRAELDDEEYERLLLKLKSKPPKPANTLEQYLDFLYDDFNLFASLITKRNAQEHAPSIKPIPSPIRYYKALIDSESDLKERLEALFESKQEEYGHIDARGLRSNELTALFVLLNDLDDNGELKEDSSLSSEEFKPLLKKIQQHIILERALIAYLEPLKSKEDEKEFACLTYRRTEDKRTIYPRAKTPSCSNCWEWTEQFIDIKYSDYQYPLRPQEKASVTNHLYPFSASPARDAIIRSLVFYKDRNSSYSNTLVDAKNSNLIQLYPPSTESHTAIIDKALYFSRDLFHLRLSPAHQIKLTLDYFSKPESIGKLQDHNVQCYVEANLFEPNLLQAALKDDPTFFERFNIFIEKGLQKFSGEGNLSNAESLFFIRLKTYMYRYIALNNPNEDTVCLLQDTHETLTKRIAVERDSSALAALHLYRFLNAITLHERVGEDDLLLQDAFSSYCYWQKTFNPFVPNDTTSLFERQHSKFIFNEWLRAVEPQAIQSLITPMMQALELDVSHLTITGTYPRFHYQNETGKIVYTVNAELGRVFQDNRSLSALPLEIKNHPLTKRLGLELETSCWLSEDENIILFQSGLVRMKKEGSRLIVQKKINEQWYQLAPLNDKQQQLFGLDTAPIPANTLPSILTDGHIDAWFNEHGALILQDNKPIYQVDNHGVFHQLNEVGKLNGCVRTEPPNAYKHLLARFEDPQFFNVHLDAQGKGSVDFARYGLSLNIVGNEITRPGTTDTLKDSSPFASNVAALTFSHGIEDQCIVAVQSFYVDASTAQIKGEYYQLTHDKSSHIPNETLKEARMWNYHNTQQTITYRVVDGQPKASTAAEALYLCYLYLATHETEKAWMILSDLSQRLSFEGSIEELKYLSWIIDHLPTVLDKEKDAYCKFETPEYVACQLKAIGLYTAFLKLGQAPNLNPKVKIDATYANGLYQQRELKNLKQFQLNIPATIYRLYTKHQQGSRHLSEKFTLQDDECNTLLRSCNPDLDRDAPIDYGALGYERRRLSLKMLLKECNPLIIPPCLNYITH